MKKTLNILFSALSVIMRFLTICSVSISFTQELPNKIVSVNPYLGNNANNYYDVSGISIAKEKSPLQSKLEAQISDLKKPDIPLNTNKIESLNKQIENISGSTVTKFEPYNGGQMRYENKPLTKDLTDDINNIRLYNNTAREIKGMATCTEQIGANAGRIWVFINFSANTTSPDSFKFVYSNDGGLTWLSYVSGNIAPLDKVNYDDLDMELIENTTGSKYLTVVYGLRANGGTGKWFTGGLAINISSFNGSFFNFVWPGNDSTKRYYNIRITSDNASFLNNPYMFVICSFDSLNSNNERVYAQKYARCLNPNTVVPAFTYQGEKFWWFSSSSPANYVRTLFSDIAYFKNGTGDSVIVSFSNAADSNRIYFAKADINGNPAAINGASSTAGADANAQKQWARLSTNGNDNGSVICVFREYINNNWNIKYFRTTNYGNFNDMFESTLLGSPVNVNYQPDIVGKRNSNSHYFTFNTIASADSVHHVKLTSDGTVIHVQMVNFVSSTAGLQGSKPGIRNINNDSCFTLYTETGPNNVWAAVGCSGSVIGVNKNSNGVPDKYVLYQNYPNPFNPTTKIKASFNPSKGGKQNIKLVIYDIMGREIAVFTPPLGVDSKGQLWEVEWDASNFPSGVYFYKLEADNFTDTKRMVLIK